ncbi:hypothetical protein D3C87_2134190 [compost metagenome]
MQLPCQQFQTEGLPEMIFDPIHNRFDMGRCFNRPAFRRQFLPGDNRQLEIPQQ